MDFAHEHVHAETLWPLSWIFTRRILHEMFHWTTVSVHKPVLPNVGFVTDGAKP